MAEYLISLILVVSGGGSAATGLGCKAQEPHRPGQGQPAQETSPRPAVRVWGPHSTLLSRTATRRARARPPSKQLTIRPLWEVSLLDIMSGLPAFSACPRAGRPLAAWPAPAAIGRRRRRLDGDQLGQG